MEFFRNITAPELGVSPIGIDVQSVPNLGTPSSASLITKSPLIDAGLLNKNLIPYFIPPLVGGGSGSTPDSGSGAGSGEGEIDVFTPTSTGEEKSAEQANYYYHPQGSNTPVYAASPSVTAPVVIEKEYVGISKTTRTLLTIGGIVAALFVLGVFKNSNVIK